MKRKDQIQLLNHLSIYIERVGSQNKAAQQIGVSAATISAVMNEQWDRLKEEMLRKIADKVKPVSSHEWEVVGTHALQEIFESLTAMQQESGCLWITGEAGSGKSTAAKLYAERTKNVFVVLCSEDMHRSHFVHAIADAIGLRVDGLTTRETLTAVVDALAMMEQPLLIFDEGDKPSDNVFHYYINLYNLLEDRCGIVFLSTDYIEKRLRVGLRCGKRGYKEISSRIGRKFFKLDPTSPHDVAAICNANGITNEAIQSAIIREAEDFDFDLRRVKKSIRRERGCVNGEG